MNDVQKAIAAVKANPPHPDSPLPWRVNGKFIEDSKREDVGGIGYRDDAAHIAAAVNAVPILIAEVERLSAAVATAERLQKEDRMKLIRCKSAMREWQVASEFADDRAVKANKEVERLQAALAAARVAAEKLWTDCRDDCASGAEIAIELCRALGLEVSP